MIGKIKRKFLPKTGMREKQLLQDPGYVDTVDTCCMLHAMTHIQSNYNVDSNTKTLNYSKIRFKVLIYFVLEQTSN